MVRLGLEKELLVERQQRQGLQKALQREQDNSAELRTQLQQLQGLHAVSNSAVLFISALDLIDGARRGLHFTAR